MIPRIHVDMSRQETLGSDMTVIRCQMWDGEKLVHIMQESYMSGEDPTEFLRRYRQTLAYEMVDLSTINPYYAERVGIQSDIYIMENMRIFEEGKFKHISEGSVRILREIELMGALL